MKVARHPKGAAERDATKKKKTCNRKEEDLMGDCWQAQNWTIWNISSLHFLVELKDLRTERKNKKKKVSKKKP